MNADGKARLLCISLDQSLLARGAQTLGDSRYHATRFAQAASECHMVVYSPEPGESFQAADNLWIHPTGSRNKPAFLPDALRIGRRICKEREIEVVYTQDLYSTGLVGYRLKQEFGVGLCCLIAGDMIGNPVWIRESLLNRVWNRVGKFLLKRADAIRVASSTEVAKLRRYGVPEERIWNLGWFLDLGRFLEADGTAVRERLLAGSGRSELLLSVGRLAPQKDFPTMLRAMRHIAIQRPDALLAIVGDGPDRPELESLAQRLGLMDRVSFLGAVPADEIPSYFAAADVFVLSSVFEGNARVLAEASAAGLPIVATETSGTRDTVLDGESGFIVEQGDDEAFAERAADLLSDPARAEAMGLRGRAHVLELFGEARLLQGFAAMFDSARS